MLPIDITRRASRQMGKAVQCWLKNRPAAPDALELELDRAFKHIASQPDSGVRVDNVRLAGVRRIYLSRTRYFLYYRIRKGRVQILALWHASRGSGPTI